MAQSEKPGPVPQVPEDNPVCPSGFGNEWTALGYKVLKRSIAGDSTYNLPPVLPEEIKILVPDFSRSNRKNIRPEDLIFFDLETTGLSGGAGTVAFLAALGYFSKVGDSPGYSLRIDQYLLLDYPGEPDFLEAVIPCLNDGGKFVVSYNGKSFDTKLFRTRCLMNGIRPPEYYEADLLHPARRLWKRVLPSCSQAEIEVSILGLDRTGDVSGAFAPQIWFDFLKSQDPADLLKICGHNKKDIEGLASLLTLMLDISVSPLEVLSKYSFDVEALALRWRDFVRWFPDNPALGQQAENLMTFSVEKKYHKCMYVYGYELMKKGNHAAGIPLLCELAEMETTASIRISALNSLAIDAEWRLKDAIKALNYVDSLLQMEDLGESFRKKMDKKRERLLKKLSF